MRIGWAEPFFFFFFFAGHVEWSKPTGLKLAYDSKFWKKLEKMKANIEMVVHLEEAEFIARIIN